MYRKTSRPESLLTIKQSAKLTGSSGLEILRAVDHGELSGIKKGKEVFIMSDDLRRWQESKRHINEVKVKGQIISFRCKYCKKKHRNPSALRLHVRDNHPEK